MEEFLEGDRELMEMMGAARVSGVRGFLITEREARDLAKKERRLEQTEKRLRRIRWGLAIMAAAELAGWLITR